jgi:Family of unknown function (DUF5996)
MAMTDDLHDSWPELPWREWQPTMSTLHMWVQIVGKVRMALAPPLNHWWHVPLYVSSRGLTTSPIPYRRRLFEVEFDFLDHRLVATDSRASSFEMPLQGKSVAVFYREFMSGLRSLGVDVEISTRPVEVAQAIPFELDEEHAAYDPAHAQAMWQGLIQAERVMKCFQSGFAGKASPVHFFWGSFDLAATRYSGWGAPLHPGGAPNCPSWVMEEAYSREEISIGWWPSSEPPGPSFYAYAYPEPSGFPSAPARPAEASYDTHLGEFILPYDVVRRAEDPDATALEFFQSTYEAGADLGGWDRPALETHLSRSRPPSAPWSTLAQEARRRPGGADPSQGSIGRGHGHGAHLARRPGP